MQTDGLPDAYSVEEVARAAAVPVRRVRRLCGDVRFLPSDAAVRLGRVLVAERRAQPSGEPGPLFARVSLGAARNFGTVPLAVSGSLHVVLLAAIVLSLGFRTSAATVSPIEAAQPMHLIFLAVPGPGGGGGGGGLLQKAPPPKAELKGTNAVAVPVAASPPAPAAPVARPVSAEPLASVVAPIVSAPNDASTRTGLLEQAPADSDSHGAGRGGGAGTGGGTGIGEGDGSGVGPGAGGGFGGGAYRPGSGITPPRVLREVKADYTDEARRRGLTGEVVLEIVVRSDGSVGSVRMLHGLGLGLDERAIAAVQQWRFAPAERLGAPVDVIVEVGVEFRLR